MLIELDGRGALYRQVYRGLRAQILTAQLPAGAQLPASRVLAQDLRVSRNTIVQAYDQLLVEGYIQGKTGSGTFVASALPDPSLRVGGPGDEPWASTSIADTDSKSPKGPAPELSEAAKRLAARVPQAPRLSWSSGAKAPVCDFRYGAPSFDDLPIAAWSRILARRARSVSAKRLSYDAPAGASELRDALARYLNHSRGVRCDAEQIIITYGTQQAVNLTLDVLVDAKDRVAIEDPQYFGFSLPLLARGVHLAPIATDAQGLRVDALESSSPCKLICVTPSHQFPGGGLMPLPRRLELIELARRWGAAILEDDYDSEFRYDGRPVSCLQGLDEGNQVIYVGSASKLLFPSLRIGWMVVPRPLVGDFQRAKAVADTGTPGIEQLAFADFLREGHLERHLRRQRLKNSAKRDLLLGEVDRHLGSKAEVAGTAAGVHLVLRLGAYRAQQERDIRDACRERGVGIYPLAPAFAKQPTQAGFILGYASLSHREIQAGVAVLAEVLEQIRPGLVANAKT